MTTTYTNTRPSLVRVFKMSFLPGETKEMPEANAKILEDKDTNGRFTHPLRKGRKPILQPGQVILPEPAPRSKVQSLSDLELPKALVQVKLCQDLETLASWHATDTRSEVLSAIDSRAKVLAK